MRLDITTDSGTDYVETAFAGQWDAGRLLDQHMKGVAPARRPRLRLTLEAAESQLARLRIRSSFPWTYEAGWDPLGLSMSDVLALPEEQGRLITWILRYGPVDLAQVAGHVDRQPNETRAMLAPLIEQGYVQELTTRDVTRYQVRLAAARPQRISGQLSQSLMDEATAGGKPRGGAGHWQCVLDRLLSDSGRGYVAAAPIVAVFLLSLGLMLSGQVTFTGPIAVVGVIAVAMLGGVFPVLLLGASRRRGNIIPAVVYRRLGQPLLLVAIFLFALTGVVVHGLFIWQEVVLRALALATALIIVVVAVDAWRQGAFARRLVFQLRQEPGQGGSVRFTVRSGDQPTPVDVELYYDEGEQRMRAADGQIPRPALLKRAAFQFGMVPDRELEVWVYAVTPDGRAEALPATLALTRGNLTERFDLPVIGGQLVRPLDGSACHLELTFPQAAAATTL